MCHGTFDLLITEISFNHGDNVDVVEMIEFANVLEESMPVIEVNGRSKAEEHKEKKQIASPMVVYDNLDTASPNLTRYEKKI